MELLKKLLSEIIGTFIFLSTIIVVVNRKSIIRTNFNGILVKPNVDFLKIGLALSICIVIFGQISGGHFNPAVSYMFFLNKQLTLKEFIIYIIGQIIGASLSLGLYRILYY